MLIIMVATTTASISVANTQSESRGVGRERMAMHARYASEAAMTTTVAWLDTVGNGLSAAWRDWKLEDPPELRGHGERPISGAFSGQRHDAFVLRLSMQAPQIDGVQPVSEAEPYSSSSGGAGGAGGAGGTSGGAGGAGGATPGPAGPDYRGSFGPLQAYAPDPYVLDATDCFLAPPQPGEPAGQRTTGRYYCVVTVRGRINVPDSLGRTFTFDGLDVTTSISGAAHDSRATILTPTIDIQ
jgi:hypothetical protein